MMTDSMAVDLAPKLYAVTVTVQDGNLTVTRRYEAPTAEEAKRMAGEQSAPHRPQAGGHGHLWKSGVPLDVGQVNINWRRVMHWTKELPLKEGWYWRRVTGGMCAAPVFVVDCGDTGRLECEDRPLKSGQFEWSNVPIDRPKDNGGG